MNGDNRMVIDCPHCKQRFGVKMPVPDVPMNTLKASVAVATHEKPIRCQSGQCGKYFIFVATSIQFGWAVTPITDAQAASLADSPISLASVSDIKRVVGELH